MEMFKFSDKYRFKINWNSKFKFSSFAWLSTIGQAYMLHLKIVDLIKQKLKKNVKL